MPYSISILEDQKRIPEIISLFRMGLGATSAEHWIWRLFTDNGQEDRPFAVIAEDETGRIAGISTVIFTRYGCCQRKCVSFCDWVVHPDDRGQGIIRRIYDYVVSYVSQRGYDFMLTFPNEESYPIFLRLGFQDMAGMSSWNSRGRLLFQRNVPADKRQDGVTYRFTKKCPIATFQNSGENRLYRTPAYMKWKYDQNPDVEYTWLTLWTGDDLVGYFVYTLTKGRLRTAVNIYDWDCSLQYKGAFFSAVSLLKTLGSYISFWGVYPERMQALLREAGLNQRDNATKCVVRAMKPGGVPEHMMITRADTDY